MAEVEVIKTTFKFRRGTEAAWLKNNPVLAAGEPSFVIDKFLFKIGDGVTAWKDLPYPNEDVGKTSGGIFNAPTLADFPEVGNSEIIYKAQEEKKLYQWNSNLQSYEELTSSNNGDIIEIKEEIENIENNIKEIEQLLKDETNENSITNRLDYLESQTQNKVDISNLAQMMSTSRVEVYDKPEGTLVRVREDEIRIMCPADTEWHFQNPGANGNVNNYYVGVKIYAPSEEVYSFKEDFGDIIQDQQMYYFEDNPYAGIDENGRKYSIIWLAVALYNQETEEWTYYGDKSTVQKYLGWSYLVEWYDKDGLRIGTDSFRINLSNEKCHNTIEPYYMGSIDANKLTQKEGDFLILYGGSAVDNI